MSKASLLALADRVDKIEKSDNALDVLIEVALFEPDALNVSVRANSAGTKVIYTAGDGRQETCWALDWTAEAERLSTKTMLRARASMEEA